jgi:hypothetical protein
MQAQPQIGRRFRQEWFQGHAEDTFKVRSLSATLTVPFGTFQHALKTWETTALGRPSWTTSGSCGASAGLKSWL